MITGKLRESRLRIHATPLSAIEETSDESDSRESR